MIKYLLLSFVLAAGLSQTACKSKKIMVEQSPEPAVETQAEEMQQDMPGTRVEPVEEGVKVTFDAAILFELNSSYLTDAAHLKLQELARALEKQSYQAIQIAGHTDSSGTDEYNAWLSERRAESVKSYLESLGIAGEKMSTRGYGESEPVASNDTPEGQAANRRVEVIISQ